MKTGRTALAARPVLRQAYALFLERPILDPLDDLGQLIGAKLPKMRAGARLFLDEEAVLGIAGDHNRPVLGAGHDGAEGSQVQAGRSTGCMAHGTFFEQRGDVGVGQFACRLADSGPGWRRRGGGVQHLGQLALQNLAQLGSVKAGIRPRAAVAFAVGAEGGVAGTARVGDCMAAGAGFVNNEAVREIVSTRGRATGRWLAASGKYL